MYYGYERYIIDPQLPAARAAALERALRHRDDDSAGMIAESGPAVGAVLGGAGMVVLVGSLMLAGPLTGGDRAGVLGAAAGAGMLALGFVLAVGSAAAAGLGERREARVLADCRGSWADTGDFRRHPAWEKVEQATRQILDAPGDVNDVEARAILAEQQWQVASALAAQRRVTENGGRQDRQAARSLREAENSTMRRAAELASYAKRHAALAAALQAPQRAAVLAELRAQARDLLPATAADRADVAWLRDHTRRIDAQIAAITGGKRAEGTATRIGRAIARVLPGAPFRVS